MARLAIRCLVYSGDKFIFKSPYLNDGLVIIEGQNGTGKSTFSDLLYFGIGGDVSFFKKSSREKHKEITNDTNNFVELSIEIDDVPFKLKRFIGSNDISVFSADCMIGIFPIFRSKETKDIFSDWILEKLNIKSFELYAKGEKGKINFTDLYRLIYHDQSKGTEIYKDHDGNGYISDSIEFRKAIFEVLVGKLYSDFYSENSKLKQLIKRLDLTKESVEIFNNAISRIYQSEDWNIAKIDEELKLNHDQLHKLIVKKDVLRNQGVPKSGQVVLENLRSELNSLQIKMMNEKEKINSTYIEMRELQELKRTVILEVIQIKKIIFSHETLGLFSPDTCPVCLNHIKREKGCCICGSNVQEEKYQHFFYDVKQYNSILKSKQRNVETISDGIKNCDSEINALKSTFERLEEESKRLEDKLTERVFDKTSFTDLSSISEVDNLIFELKLKIHNLEKQLSLENERQKHEDEISNYEDELRSQRVIVEKLQIKAKEDIQSTLEKFGDKYSELLKDTIKNCRRARLSDDYMPVINNGDYIEASAIVPKRMMYFLTLLYLSLIDSQINFPKFLLIDTPDNAGIDDDSLKKSIAKITEIIEINPSVKSQVILTTGINIYPAEMKEHVVLRLTHSSRLLKEVNSQQ